MKNIILFLYLFYIIPSNAQNYLSQFKSIKHGGNVASKYIGINGTDTTYVTINIFDKNGLLSENITTNFYNNKEVCKYGQEYFFTKTQLTTVDVYYFNNTKYYCHIIDIKNDMNRQDVIIKKYKSQISKLNTEIKKLQNNSKNNILLINKNNELVKEISKNIRDAQLKRDLIELNINKKHTHITLF